MAIKRPDIYEHNNPAYAIADSDFVRGGTRTPVADLTGLYSLSGNTDQLKEHATLVYVTGETKYYILIDINNIGNSSGWAEFQTGGGAGTITGGTNGLGVSGADIVLGGTLDNNTIIDGNNNDLSITNINEFQISTSGATNLFGVDTTGILLFHSGTSVSLESNAGLTYDGDYESNFLPRSLVTAQYVTGLTSGYLHLDQTVSEHVTGSQPIFDEGIIIGETPTASQITGHTKGKMYYDDTYQTVSVDIGDETKLQLGQEDVQYVYNNTGNIIPDGVVVRDTGVYSGGGGVDATTIDLAIASGITSANVIGITTQVISINGFGYITTRGNINGLDTNNGQYSGITAGDDLYLSETVSGGVTNIEPTAPNIRVRIGRLMTKDSTNGKIFVNVRQALSLNNLIDVVVPSPNLDDVLKYNGLNWVNGQVGGTSAGSGVNLYYSTPIINSRTSPAGLSEDGTAGNGIQLATLSKVPVTTGSTLLVAGLDGSDTRAFVAWVRNDVIQRTTIDSGLWEFYDYTYVSNTAGETYLIHQMYQVTNIIGSTITITGTTANSRTATITSNQFSGTYFAASVTNTVASYLQTPSGIYQISAVGDDNTVTITVPTGYVNESGVSGSTWNKLFGGSTISIEDTISTLYQTKIIAPAFTVATTDMLGQIAFVQSSGAVTLSLTYNGTTAASFIITPLVTLHNDLAGLQGGTGTERYHLDAGQVAVVNATSNTNTGDETIVTIESKLIGTITTHTHPYSGLTDLPNLNIYQTVSGFTGYTTTTQPILDGAITGATNLGGGIGVYDDSIIDRELQLNSIVGSGLTTVQKIGNEIVVYTSGATGGGEYIGQSPSAVNLCGITIGYELTGKTLSCIIQDLLVPELYGTVTGPSIGINLTCSGIKEIGCSLSQTVTGNYNQGCINPQYLSVSDKRSGLPISYTFTGTGMPVPPQTCTALSAAQVNPTYVVVSGNQSWGVSTCYNAGSPALGSKGTEYCAALPEGNTSAVTGSITGILPWFWGTSLSPTITSTVITGGTKVVTNVATSTPITFNATTEYLWFAAPAGTYTTKTKWWVCAANAGSIGGVGNLWAASCPVSVTSGQGCWSGCSFDVYVTCGITTTAAGIAMCLYS